MRFHQEWNRLGWCDPTRMVSVKLDLLTLTELLANLKGVSLLEELSGNEFSSKCWESSVIIVQSLVLLCRTQLQLDSEVPMTVHVYEELHFNQFIMQVSGLLGKTYQSLYWRRRFQYCVYYVQDITWQRKLFLSRYQLWEAATDTSEAS